MFPSSPLATRSPSLTGLSNVTTSFGGGTSSLLSGGETAIDPYWTPTEFIPFANLAESPPVLGHALVNLVVQSKGEQRLPSAAEVELMIRAHYCFGLVNLMDGMDQIYQMIRERVPGYIDRGELGLLVRLVTGIQKYREMQYVFDALVDNDMFKLILRKAMDKEGQWELKLALRD